MENILAAIVIIFILLFGALTLSNAFLSAQEIVVDASRDAEERLDDQRHIAFEPVSLTVRDAGVETEVLVRNVGMTKLADYELWDVFVEYYDNAVTPVYHSLRLIYDDTGAAVNSWSVGGLFIDRATNAAEVHDLGVFNPGEEIALLLNILPVVGVGQSINATVSDSSGVVVSLMAVRDAAPQLTRNTGFRIANLGSAVITSDMLLATDVDNDADELNYAIITPPGQGALTPSDNFTQVDIDEGEVTYTHSGSGADSFSFLLTDGIEVVGPFTTLVTINVPPVLEANSGMTIPSGAAATITNTLLRVADADDLPERLIYTMVQFPSNGALSLGSTFSQADIDGNRLTYTHAGGGADLFRFVVSDGYDVIGTYTFVIDISS
ncbi:MAG: hypothetical protein IPK19_01195 [Chloroflexi bacterium]|nr:hypothetical protein [Chloroflexota bacterium]